MSKKVYERLEKLANKFESKLQKFADKKSEFSSSFDAAALASRIQYFEPGKSILKTMKESNKPYYINLILTSGPDKIINKIVVESNPPLSQEDKDALEKDLLEYSNNMDTDQKMINQSPIKVNVFKKG